MSRNPTVDVAKGLSILLVILGHSPWMLAHAEAVRMLSSFRMPLFFFLAGVFLRPQDELSTFWRSKADALLKPYFVVLTAAGLIETLWAGTAPLPFFAGMLYASGPAMEARWCALWFLPHLFLALVAVHAVLRLQAGKPWSPWVLAGGAMMLMNIGVQSLPLLWRRPVDLGWGLWAPVAVPGSQPFQLPGLPFSADLLLITSAFVMGGHLLSVQVKRFKVQPLWLLTSLLVFFVLHGKYDQTMTLYARRYDDFVNVTLEAASGIYLALAMSSLLAALPRATRTLSICGRSSLFLLLFHGPVQDAVIDAMNHTFLARHTSLLFAFAYVCAVVLPLLLLAVARRTPWMALLLLPLSRRRVSPQPPTPSRTGTTA